MRPIDPAVIARKGGAGSVHAAEMTASAFQLARVQPLRGRPLMEEDEREGADPVAVIGYELWQSGFSSEPDCPRAAHPNRRHTARRRRRDARGVPVSHEPAPLDAASNQSRW